MKIYYFNIADASAEQLAQWFEQMSDERRQAVMQMKVEQKRNLRIAADALSRKAIAEFCGVSPAEIIFDYTQHGKPYVKGLPVHFSISHSGDIAVCAVSDNEIGIDIEKIRAVNPRSAEKFASEKEKEYIRTAENGFFKIWTLKEAYFKCTGTGLGSDIKDVTFDVSDSVIACSENGYELSFYETDKNYICSICKKTAQN